MTRPEILDTAKKCVCGDREQDYGTPEENFSTIAELWNTYALARQAAASKAGELRVVSDTVIDGSRVQKSVYDITPVDVAIMMALVKIGRIASGHSKSDNWVDACGYMAIGGEIEAGKDKPKPLNIDCKSITSCELTQEIREELFSGIGGKQ